MPPKRKQVTKKEEDSNDESSEQSQSDGDFSDKVFNVQLKKLKIGFMRWEFDIFFSRLMMKRKELDRQVELNREKYFFFG